MAWGPRFFQSVPFGIVHRFFFSLSASTSDVFDWHLNDYSNPTLFALNACSIVSERVPTPFVLHSLIHAGF